MCYYNSIETAQRNENNMSTMVTYTNNENNFDLVLIKSDDSFVIVGNTDVSDSDLAKMVNWEEVTGWAAL